MVRTRENARGANGTIRSVEAPSGKHTFPVLRWIAPLWLVVWLPAYARVWGWSNFLHVCDVSVILTCLGLLLDSPLLLSSQAVGSLLADLAWCLDVGSRLIMGRHIFGGTEYMWDAQYPAWVRLLSLFHVALPAVLLWALRRAGYDRRALVLQSAIAGVLLVASRFFGPALNLNYAYRDPLLHRMWGPAPMHLALILIAMVALLYFPTHLLLARIFREPSASFRHIPGVAKSETRQGSF